VPPFFVPTQMIVSGSFLHEREWGAGQRTGQTATSEDKARAFYTPKRQPEEPRRHRIVIVLRPGRPSAPGTVGAPASETMNRFTGTVCGIVCDGRVDVDPTKE